MSYEIKHVNFSTYILEKISRGFLDAGFSVSWTKDFSMILLSSMPKT